MTSSLDDLLKTCLAEKLNNPCTCVILAGCFRTSQCAQLVFQRSLSCGSPLLHLDHVVGKRDLAHRIVPC